MVRQPETADLDAYVYVPTQGVRRFLGLAAVLRPLQTHLMLLGPPGCGKSAALNELVPSLPLGSAPPILPASFAMHNPPVKPQAGFGDRVDVRYLCVCPWTPLGRWERFLQKPLVHAGTHTLRPPLGVLGLCVVDDCHCAPAPLGEAWCFFLERGLVHTPGACAQPPSRGVRASAAAAGAAGRKGVERPEREPPPPGVRKLENVMLLLAGRTDAAGAMQRVLRHVWLFGLEEINTTDMYHIIAANTSHFMYVKDMPSEIANRKTLYVRLIHGLMCRHAGRRGASPSLITPHVLSLSLYQYLSLSLYIYIYARTFRRWLGTLLFL